MKRDGPPLIQAGNLLVPCDTRPGFNEKVRIWHIKGIHGKCLFGWMNDEGLVSITKRWSPRFKYDKENRTNSVVRKPFPLQRIRIVNIYCFRYNILFLKYKIICFSTTFSCSFLLMRLSFCPFHEFLC